MKKGVFHAGSKELNFILNIIFYLFKNIYYLKINIFFFFILFNNKYSFFFLLLFSIIYIY